mmetsp:Transcript_3393/g.8825  ORF Transcript_3393/g.8825 Transcript_3393/m.8825 type:complete len:292 (+) Transcript_3393:635-1510(+)
MHGHPVERGRKDECEHDQVRVQDVRSVGSRRLRDAGPALVEVREHVFDDALERHEEGQCPHNEADDLDHQLKVKVLLQCLEGLAESLILVVALDTLREVRLLDRVVHEEDDLGARDLLRVERLARSRQHRRAAGLVEDLHRHPPILLCAIVRPNVHLGNRAVSALVLLVTLVRHVKEGDILVIVRPRKHGALHRVVQRLCCDEIVAKQPVVVLPEEVLHLEAKARLDGPREAGAEALERRPLRVVDGHGPAHRVFCIANHLGLPAGNELHSACRDERGHQPSALHAVRPPC